jgi:hypothetical protein
MTLVNHTKEELKQRVLNLAIKVTNNLDFDLDSGFLVEVVTPTLLVGSYAKLNHKKPGETPLKEFQRLIVNLRIYRDTIRVIVSASKFHTHPTWKKEMTDIEFDNWLSKVEDLIKNNVNTDPKYFSQIERGITY